MRFLLLIILIIQINFAKAIGPIGLLQKKFPVNNSQVNSKKYVGIAENRSAFSQYNPVTLFFNGSMYIYQKGISEQLASQCTFTPSCSEFSKKLIQNYGLIKGIFLSADRLMRCNGHATDEYPSSWIDRQSDKLIDPIDIYRWRNNF